jgi:subfamily B ATP-binding cassette protein MsbA
LSQSSESPAESPSVSPSQSSTGAHLSSRILIRRLIRDNVRPYFGRIGIAMIFMAIVGGATAFSALLMKNIVDDVFIAKDEAMLWLVGGAILITFIAKGVANYIQATLMSHVGLRVIADCQNRLYAHLAHMDLAFFHNTPTGTLLSRFTIDISAMRAVVSSVLTSLGKDLISLIGLVAVMFYRDWKLATISFIIFIVAVYPIIRLGRRTRKVTANTQQETGLLTTLLEQTIQGIRVVKSYGMEAYEKGRVAVIVDRIYQLSFKAARVRALSSPIMESLGGIAIAFVVIYGGYRTIEGETTPGSFFSFITAFLLAYEPMKRLANLNITMQEGLAGAQRYFSVISNPTYAKKKTPRTLR